MHIQLENVFAALQFIKATCYLITWKVHNRPKHWCPRLDEEHVVCVQTQFGAYVKLLTPHIWTLHLLPDIAPAT